MSAPVPVASVGQNPQVAQHVRDKLLPEYEGELIPFPSHSRTSSPTLDQPPKVVHVSIGFESALAELPLITSGDVDLTAASGLGSNAALAPAERKIPKHIILGAGISDDDAQALTETVLAKAPDVKFARVTRQDMLERGATQPNPDLIAQVLKEKLAQL